MAEKKQPFTTFIGPSYQDRAHVYDAQETINFYLETDETGMGKNDQKIIFIGTPGLRKLQTIGLGPIRGTYTISNQLVSQQFSYIVSGNEVYQLAGGNAIPVQIVGNLTTTRGPVSIADNGHQVVFVDGVNGYYINIGTSGWTATVPSYSGVGNGTISDITVNQGTADAEFWTLTATSPTTFSVVGSVSGAQAGLTTGVLYTGTQFALTITAGSTPFVNGDYYQFSISNSGTLNVIDPNVVANFYPTDYVTFQDDYFIFNWQGTKSFFVSDPNSITFPDANIGSKSGNSDLLVAAVSVSRQLYVMGVNTTEIWFNSGSTVVGGQFVGGSQPFTRQDGRFSQVGCASPASIAVIGEQFCWLGSNAQGTGIVYTLEGSLPKRISTHAVEYSIQNTTGNIGNSTAFTYQSEGHYFYCLNVPGLNCTWVYDMVTQQWHKRADWPDGIEGRWYAQTHCLLNDIHIVGDYRNGNIYQLDLDCYTDNGDPRYYVRQTPHVANNLNNVFYKLLEIDFQFGVGLPNTNMVSAYPNPPIPPSYYSNPHSFSDTVPPQLLSFTTSPTEPIANEPVQFTNTSSPALGGVGWDFGDGNTSGDPNPIHTYTQTGTFYPSMLASVVFDTTPPLYTLQWTHGNISEVLTNGTYTELIYTYGHFTINGIPTTSGVTPSTHTITYTITTTALSGPAIVTSYQTISGYPNSGSPMIEQSIISPGVPTSGPFGNNGVFATDGGDRGFFYDTMVSITANVDGAQVGNTLNVRMTPIGSTGGSGSATAQLTYTTSSSPTGYIPSTNVLIASPLVVSEPEPSPSSDPRVTLLISNDGGLTWGNPIYSTLGKIGRYTTRARFDRLGFSRDRVFKVIVTEAVKVQMLMAMMDLEVGSA